MSNRLSEYMSVFLYADLSTFLEVLKLDENFCTTQQLIKRLPNITLKKVRAQIFYYGVWKEKKGNG